MSQIPEIPVGHLLEYQGSWGLIFSMGASELDRLDTLLTQQGHYPNGHGWSNLFAHYLSDVAPALTPTLVFDPEADTVSIRSQQRETLVHVAHLLAQLLQDAPLLQRVAAQTPPD